MALREFFSKIFSRKKRILIIDDNPDLLEAVATILEIQGHRALKAVNGQEGLTKAGAEEPKLILLDINMPDIDGWRVLQTLRAMPKTKAIPVVMLTSITEMENISKAFQMGAQGYLPKPLNSESLIKKINEILPL